MCGIIGFVGFVFDNQYYIYFYSTTADTDENIRNTILDELSGLDKNDVKTWSTRLKGKCIDLEDLKTKAWNNGTSLLGNIYLEEFFHEEFVSLDNLLDRLLLQSDKQIPELLKCFDCNFFHILDLNEYTYRFYQTGCII